MKKSFIAVCMLFATTQALAMDVDYFGKFREFIEIDNITGGTSDNKPGAKLTNFISRVGIRLTQPLNDVTPGLKLNAVLDTLFFPDAPMQGLGTAPTTRSTVLGSNQATVGFSNDRFTADFGRSAHAVWMMMRKYGPYSDLFGTPQGEIHNRRNLRFNNAIFLSAKVTDNITVGFDYQLSETQAVPNPKTFMVSYVNGSLDLSAAHYDNGTSENVSNIIGAAYTFPTNTRVALLVSSDKASATTISNVLFPADTTTGVSISARQRLNDKWSAEAGYSHRDDGVDGYIAGVQYQLNKNIAIQARGQYVKADNVINFTTSNDLAGGVLGKERINAGIGMEITF
jgi:predicted porin